MPAIAYQGDTTRITVTFRDFEGNVEDPVSVTWEILEAPLAATPVVHLGPGVPTKQSDGVYYYDWTPTTVGSFVVRFTGTFADTSVDIVDQAFDVIQSSATEVPTETLGFDFVFEFASGLDPLYVAPEELVDMFPDATLLDAAEALHKASLEVQELLKLQEDEVPVWVALDYILAAAACTLSKVFDISSGDELSIRLGDLSVTNRSFPKNSVNRGNATTPCEYAAALRREMLLKSTKSKATVRGSSYPNPIPNRKFIDRTNGRPPKEVWYQGRLDDNDGSP